MRQQSIGLFHSGDILQGIVEAVCLSWKHDFSKKPQERVFLIAGRGVEGDAHKSQQNGATDGEGEKTQNLRQVHLMPQELLDELGRAGFTVSCGSLGENITTRGIDLVSLPYSTRLHLGRTAVIALTGVRFPCVQMERYQSGLASAVLDRSTPGALASKAGVLGIVLADGEVQRGDRVRVGLPSEHLPLPRM